MKYCRIYLLFKLKIEVSADTNFSQGYHQKEEGQRGEEVEDGERTEIFRTSGYMAPWEI